MIPSRSAVVRRLFYHCLSKFPATSLVASTACLSFLLSGCVAESTATGSVSNNESVKSNQQQEFLVIAHRGASGYRPEHTLAAYQLAIDQGADFIELDLVPTKDGVLIARHENALALVQLDSAGGIERDQDGVPTVIAATTDVAEREEFADLLRLREIDGRTLAGWFSEDFTHAQIKTLRARERIPQLRPDSASYKDLQIPDLEQILNLLEKPGNGHVGAYPELKHPTHFLYGQRDEDGAQINLDTAEILVRMLAAKGFTDPNRLFIQCFEVATLRRLKHQLLPTAGFDAPLVQLLGRLEWQLPDVRFHLSAALTKENPNDYLSSIYGPLANSLRNSSSYESLAEIIPMLAADYAAGIGPGKGNAATIAETTQTLGLELHPYTLRSEPYFLSPERGALGRTVEEELDVLRAMGATGVFIDHPDVAVNWAAR